MKNYNKLLQKTNQLALSPNDQLYTRVFALLELVEELQEKVKILEKPTSYYTKEIVIELLRSMLKAADPRAYKSSQDLYGDNFADVPFSYLEKLGLTEEEVFLSDPNFIPNWYHPKPKKE